MGKATPSRPVKKARRVLSAPVDALHADTSPLKKRDPQIGSEFKLYRGLKNGVDTNYDSITALRDDGATNPKADCSYYRYVRAGYRLNYEDNGLPENLILRQTKLELRAISERAFNKTLIFLL